jgi:hypothetical protein
MSLDLKQIPYEDLKPRQQEGYNFQKVSAVLADFGYVTIRLTNDWCGADFIAQHFDGISFLKVQLKGRLTFSKKYRGQELFICFHLYASLVEALYSHSSRGPGRRRSGQPQVSAPRRLHPPARRGHLQLPLPRASAR